jgi:integrase
MAAAHFMVFVPCRPCALVRLDVAKARIRPSDQAIIVPAQEKTDFGRGVTELAFRRAEETKLSAAYYYDILWDRATDLGCETALFCSEKGVPYTSPNAISNSLVDLLHDMDIQGYTAYSLRHALIQALFDAGLTETQVNAYTGHSHKSHTAITWYYHLDKNWAGQKIRALSAEALRVIQADMGEDE